MAKKSTKGRKKRKPLQSREVIRPNFLSEAGPGCYIARRERSPDWLIEWEDVDPQEFEGEEVPDIAVDIEEHTLSVCNVESFTKVAYVTVFDTRVLGAKGTELIQGFSTDNQGATTSCVTFIILCPPRVFVHLCFLDVAIGEDISKIRIESDVQKWNEHPDPQDEHPERMGFPLQGGPFLCTQGENGQLTHFFAGNLHAIDFRCPVGTPLLAVANGVIVESKDTNTLTGISVNNLFEWNSIILQVDTSHNDCEFGGPLYVEYVHIQNAKVKIGDRVERGQMIGTSGSVGFSPEPHLHFSAFRSVDPTAPTVRVQFDNEGANKRHQQFLPKAGSWYSATGLVDPPSL